MKFLSRKPNDLQQRIEMEYLATTVKNVNEVSLNDFPKLTEAELRDIALGLYQLNQARSYTQEHLPDNGSYNISVHRFYNTLLRAKI